MTLPGQPGQPGQSGQLPREGGAPRMEVEGTRWSWGLVGFYLSCAGTALGATVAAAGKMWFDNDAAMIAGIVLTAGSTIACFLTLAAARKKSG